MRYTWPEPHLPLLPETATTDEDASSLLAPYRQRAAESRRIGRREVRTRRGLLRLRPGQEGAPRQPLRQGRRPRLRRRIDRYDRRLVRRRGGRQDVEAGRLVPLLQDKILDMPIPVYLVYYSDKAANGRVRCLIDYLSEHINLRG